MPKYKINYGLGGAFGMEEEEMEFRNEEEANQNAYELARQYYESYEGYHGIRSVQDVIDDEEEDVSYKEAYEIYEDEVEDTINYYVELIEE
jgi:hypothetical protein